MKKYHFVSVLVFGFVCGPLWGGSGWSVFLGSRESPDQQLQEHVQEVLGGGARDVDDRMANDLLPQLQQFRLDLEERVNGLGQVDVEELLALAGPDQEGGLYEVIQRVLTALNSEEAQSVDYALFIGELERAV